MTINNTITMTDHMTGTLKSIIRTLNMMISNMQRLDSATNVIGRDVFSRMRAEITSAEVSLSNLENELISVNLAQGRAASVASSWSMKLMGVYSALGILTLHTTKVVGFLFRRPLHCCKSFSFTRSPQA